MNEGYYLIMTEIKLSESTKKALSLIYKSIESGKLYTAKHIIDGLLNENFEEEETIDEETYRKESLSGKSTIIEMSSTSININEAISEGYCLDGFPSQFETYYDDEDKVWECYDSYADEDFTDTTLRKVITNIRRFYKADPIVTKTGTLTIKIK